MKLLGPWRHWLTAGLTMLLPPEAPASLSFTILPDRWNIQLAKIAKPSRTVWTYWHLGDDLFGQPDPARRAVILHLFRELHWPKGSIALWPVCEPQGDFLVASPELYWHGATALCPQALVFFGPKSFETALSIPQKYSSQLLLNIIPMLELPELGPQLLDEPTALASCLRLLRTLEPNIFC